MALWVPALLLLGLAAWALAMDRHHEHLPRRWRGGLARSMLRALGIAGIASSLACAVTDSGGSQGVLLWLGWVAPSALAVIGVLARRARRRTP
ncbi:DUF3325 family protein [Variovorax sp. LT1R16]|uniref:DUF3325 family protein n=1 Tax=Variovorax sp. LT1R16 TaxID=3443728 RepID=UPI003F450A54